MISDVPRIRRITQYIAIGFGVNLMFGETLRNWGEWPSWEAYAFDYAYAILLILLGLNLHRTRYVISALTAIVWILTIFLFTQSLIGHIEHIDEPTYGLIEQVPLTIIIGVLDLVAVIGLIFTMLTLYTTMTSTKRHVS